MNHFTKKINFILSLLLLTTSVGYSNEEFDCSPCTENVPCCPCTPVCGKGFVVAGLLVWRAHLDGLDTCVPISTSDTILPDGRIISTFQGEGRDPRFNWNAGFRLGAGYAFANSQWDVGAFWTHFNSKARGSHDNDNGFRWNIDLDVVDITTAYQYNCNSCFALRPYIGIRGVRIEQKVRYGASPNATTFAIAGSSLFDRDNKQKFEGLGPLFGLEANLNVGCGFSVYVNGAVSWLYGRNNARLIDSTATVDVIDYCDIHNKTNTTLTAADASLGVRWQTCFCTDKQLYLQLGFEHHSYYNFDRLCDSGDLNFDGLQLGVGIGF